MYEYFHPDVDNELAWPTNRITRDLRYTDEDGYVLLRPEIAKDVVKPDPIKVARFFNQ